MPTLMTTRTPGSFQQKAPLKPPQSAPASSNPDVEKRKEWMAFLRNNGLLHHADMLLRNGFDDMESMLEMEDADMKDLGIPAHDAVRLRKSLQHLRGGSLPAVDEQHPVVAFLRECGLPQYSDVLLRNGFEDMESLLEIQDSDMRDLGLQRGHALKLAKRLREHNPSDYAAPPPAQPQPQLVPRQPKAAPFVASHPRHDVQAAPFVASHSRHDVHTTDAQTSAVQRSWQRVQHLGANVLGEKLYKHTFRMAPHVMALFPPEVRYKYRDWSADENGSEEGSDVFQSPALKKLFGKVINAVGVSVAGLREPSQMVPMLTQLGARHISYNVDEGYWKVLGEALILTLEECLGSEFTTEVQLAWTLVYGFISAVMIEGLRGAHAARSAVASEGGRSVKSADGSSVISEGKTDLLRSVSEDRETVASIRHEEPDAEDIVSGGATSDSSSPEVAKVGRPAC